MRKVQASEVGRERSERSKKGSVGRKKNFAIIVERQDIRSRSDASVSSK